MVAVVSLQKMKEDESPAIDVTKPTMMGDEVSSDKRFKTIKLLGDDLRAFAKPPQKFWDDSFIGEAVADDCHPPNSSFIIGATGNLITFINYKL